MWSKVVSVCVIAHLTVNRNVRTAMKWRSSWS